MYLKSRCNLGHVQTLGEDLVLRKVTVARDPDPRRNSNTLRPATFAR